MHSTGDLAPPPLFLPRWLRLLRSGPPPSAPTLTNSPTFVSRRKASTACVERANPRGPGVPPLAGPSRLFPQGPDLRGPRLAPDEEVVAGLPLVSPTPPASVGWNRLHLAVEVRLGGRVARGELIIPAREGLTLVLEFLPEPSSSKWLASPTPLEMIGDPSARAPQSSPRWRLSPSRRGWSLGDTLGQRRNYIFPVPCSPPFPPAVPYLRKAVG